MTVIKSSSPSSPLLLPFLPPEVLLPSSPLLSRKREETRGAMNDADMQWRWHPIFKVGVKKETLKVVGCLRKKGGAS